MALLKKSATYFIGRVFPAVLSMGAVALYTRHLDPASVGTYAVLLASSLFASALGYTWLRVAALRLASGDPKLEPNLAATVIWCFLAVSVLVAIAEGGWLLLSMHPNNRPLSTFTIELAVAAAISSAFYDLIGTLLQAQLRVVAWGTLNVVRATAAVSLSLGLIFAGLKADALLAGFVLGNLTTLMFIGLWRPALDGHFDVTIFRRLVVFGWPGSVNAATGRAAPTAQRYLLYSTGGSSAVGLFSVAADFATQTMSILIGSVSLAGIPLAFQAKDRGGVGVLDRQLRENARLIFAMALPAAVGLAMLSDSIAHIFLGPRFQQDAGLVIAIVDVAAFAGGLRIYYFDQAFELSMRTHPQAIISTVSTGVEILLDILFIPHYGVIGAACIAAIGQVIGLTWSVLWGSRVLRMPVPTRSWLKSIAAAIGMIGVIIAVPSHGMGFIGLGLVLIYAALAYVVFSALLRINVMRAQFGHRFSWMQRS